MSYASLLYALYSFPVFFHIFQGDAEYIAEDCFAGIKTVLRLLKIICLRVVVHIKGYFIDTRQRMKDTQVGTGVFQHFVAQYVDVLYTFVLHKICETFALHTESYREYLHQL